MTNTSTTLPTLQSEAETTVHLLDNWFDAIEFGLRERVREFIQAMIESELETALARPRYGRRPKRLHEEFKRRIKTQTVLPSADTAAMLFWALLAAGQITMRKVDGWQTLTHKLADEPTSLPDPISR